MIEHKDHNSWLETYYGDVVQYGKQANGTQRVVYLYPADNSAA